MIDRHHRMWTRGGHPISRRSVIEQAAAVGGATVLGACTRVVSIVIETGQYDAKSLITATYPLEHMRDAFQAVVDRTTVAAVLVFA